MRRVFSPGRLVLYGLALLAIAAAVLWLTPSNDYLLLPDRAHPVAPLVTVAGRHAPPATGGSIYFLDVIERPASLLESVFRRVPAGGDLVDRSLLMPAGTSDAARRVQSLEEMATSQKVAAAVALRAAGYHVRVVPTGVIVTAVDPHVPAAALLHAGDVIVAVDGRPVTTPARLRDAIGARRPGLPVTLGLREGRKVRSVTVRTVASPSSPRRAIVGILPDQAAHVVLPFKVSIDAGNVGGPSAGLAFALQVLEKLGRDVDHGYRVAATGALSLDGTVSPIGGVKQKTYGAEHAGVEVMLVPAGDNYTVARSNARGMRVIPVKSFQQALHDLATLPPKSR